MTNEEFWKELGKGTVMTNGETCIFFNDWTVL